MMRMRLSAVGRYLVSGVLAVLLLTAAAWAAFSDVPPDYWCAAPIGEMERRGIVNGYADGTFRPTHPVTAAQFVVMVSRCADTEVPAEEAVSTENASRTSSGGIPGIPGENSPGISGENSPGISGSHAEGTPVGNAADSGSTDKYAAAHGTHWAADTLAAALRAGWYDWDELPPTGERYDLPITRVLAAKILMKALLPEVRGDYLTESQKIRDFSQLDGRYYEAVLAAYAAGVLQGDSGGNFNPTGGLTRAAACAVLSRALSIREEPQSGDSSREKGTENKGDSKADTPNAPPKPGTAVRGGVSENGWLTVKGTQLFNEMGEPVFLRGMSSHGLQWYGQYASLEAVRNTAAWGANLFRAAMYTGEGGYLASPDAMREKLVSAVDAAAACDMYAIIDWHILSDGNPVDHADEAAAFFTDMARRYRDCPAVLYEICNEPNGNVSWERDIKPYAERMIQVIREQSPRAVILIGSTTWSQDIHLAAQSPVKGENLLYTFHFYAGTHGEDLRRRLRDAVTGGLPVFVTEWGTSRADGGGGVYLDEAEKWLDLLDELGVSWANWSLCDKGESSAALVPGTKPDSIWQEADLTPSGRFVFSRLGS